MRAATEVVVEQDLNEGLCFISIKARGCQMDLSNIPQFTTLPINGRVSLALEYVQNSSLCTGISLPEGESIQVLVAHVTGSFKDGKTQRWLSS